MNYSWIDFFTLIGSVGLFLYGMKLMSEGLQKIAGDRLRSILAIMTNNRFSGMITGVLVTALVQSSSATTVMIVSFVNAGLISLAQSMAVIMGANVGTTITTWIIAIFGFKFNISLFIFPLIALTLPLFTSSNTKKNSWGEFIIGFALLFLGLDSLNHSVPDLKSNQELFALLTQYSEMGYASIIIFVLIGMVLTMVVQASSASFTIALIMCSKGWISFEMGCALILGSNIGTCITPLIASFSGNTMAKRAAMGHLLFNVLGTVWALVFYYPFCRLVVYVTQVLGQGDPTQLMTFVSNLEQTDPALASSLTAQTVDTSDPASARALATFTTLQGSVSFAMTIFHTIFNLINLSIMIWLTQVYVTIVSKLIPEKSTDQEAFSLKYISQGLIASGEISLLQVKKETVRYAEETYRMFIHIQQMLNERLGSEKQIALYEQVKELENESDKAEVEIANFLNHVSTKALSPEGELLSRQLYKMVDELESVADSIYHIAITLRDKSEARCYFTPELNDNLHKMIALVDVAMQHMIKCIQRGEISDQALNRAYNYEDEINNLRNQLRSAIIDQMNKELELYQQSTFYMDLINECEKVGDYIINVLTAMSDKQHR
jgi:phosphate:Na+ symporter